MKNMFYTDYLTKLKKLSMHYIKYFIKGKK